MSMTNAYIPGLRAAVGHGLPGRPQRQSSAAQGGGGSGGKLPLMLQFFPTKAEVPPNYVALDGDHWDARLNAVDLGLSDKTLMPSRGPAIAIAGSSSNPTNGPGEFSPDGRFFVLHNASGLRLKVLDMTYAGNVTERAGVNPAEVGSNAISSLTVQQGGMIALTVGGTSGANLLAYLFNEENNTLTKITFPNLVSEMGGINGFNWARFSPDGSHLALASSRGVGVYRLNGATFEFVTKYGTTNHAQVEWLSNAELAVTDTAVRRLLFDGTALQLSVAWTMSPGNRRFFSPDKKYFASVSDSSAVVYVSLYRIGEGAVTALFTNKVINDVHNCRVIYFPPGEQEIVCLVQRSLSGGGFGDAYSVRLSIPSGATIAGPSLLEGCIPNDSYGPGISQGGGNSVALCGYNKLFLLRPPKPYLQNSAGMAAVKVS